MAAMERGFRDIVITLTSRVCSLALGLLFQSSLAWLLTPLGRGEYAVCLTFTALISNVFTFGMDWSNSYFISSKKMTASQSFSFSWINIFFISVIGVPICFGLIALPVNFFSQASPDALLISCFWMVSMVGVNFGMAQLRGLQEFNALALVSFIRGISAVVMTVVFIYYLKFEVLGAIFSNIIADVIIILAMIYHQKKKLDIHLSLPSRNIVIASFNYGRRAFLGTIGMQANARIGILILAFFVSPRELAFFAVGMGFLAQIITISDVVGNVIQPRVAISNDGRIDLVCMSCRMVFFLAITACSVILIFGKPIILILFSEKYISVLQIMKILAIGVVFRCLGKTLFPFFNGVNKPEIISVATMLNLVVNMSTLIIFIPYYGLIGASFATTFGYLFSTTYLVWKFKENTDIQIFTLMLPRSSDFNTLVKSIKAFFYPRKPFLKV